MYAQDKRRQTTRLSVREVDERLVGEDDGDIRLRGRLALIHGPVLLRVDRPCHGLLGVVADLELEDAVRLS